MAINDGGPAYPALEEHGVNSGCPGMSLRDHCNVDALIAQRASA